MVVHSAKSDNTYPHRKSIFQVFTYVYISLDIIVKDNITLPAFAFLFVVHKKGTTHCVMPFRCSIKFWYLPN